MESHDAPAPVFAWLILLLIQTLVLCVAVGSAI
jgi:hypothetical protein